MRGRTAPKAGYFVTILIVGCYCWNKNIDNKLLIMHLNMRYHLPGLRYAVGSRFFGWILWFYFLIMYSGVWGIIIWLVWGWGVWLNGRGSISIVSNVWSTIILVKKEDFIFLAPNIIKKNKYLLY